jgi:hypothetical protein
MNGPAYEFSVFVESDIQGGDEAVSQSDRLIFLMEIRSALFACLSVTKLTITMTLVLRMVLDRDKEYSCPPWP